MMRARVWAVAALAALAPPAVVAAQDEERGGVERAVEAADARGVPLVLVVESRRRPELADRLAGLLETPPASEWVEEHALVERVPPGGANSLFMALTMSRIGFDKSEEVMRGALVFVRDGEVVDVLPDADAPDAAGVHDWLRRASRERTAYAEARAAADEHLESDERAWAAWELCSYLQGAAHSSLSPLRLRAVFDEAWSLALVAGWSWGVDLLCDLRDAAVFDDERPLLDEGARRALRDTHEASLREGRGTNLELAAWILLNQSLGDHERIGAWAERNKDRPEANAFFQHWQLGVFDSLVVAGAWRLAGQTLVMPAVDAEVEKELHNNMDHDIFGADEVMHDLNIEWALEREDRTRTRLTNLYTACLAAERWGDAKQIADAAGQVREDLPLLRLSMVLTATDAGVARDEHMAWLDEAEAAGVALPEGLRERVRAMLDALPR